MPQALRCIGTVPWGGRMPVAPEPHPLELPRRIPRRCVRWSNDPWRAPRDHEISPRSSPMAGGSLNRTSDARPLGRFGMGGAIATSIPIPRCNMPSDRTHPDALPAVPKWLQNGFHRFLGRYLRRQFDSVAVTGANHLRGLDQSGQPLIVYGNHPSWWDPVIAHFLNDRLLPHRQFRAPIDADALEQYQIFKKLGFFGVEQQSRRGAAEFLRHAKAVMASSLDALWITPEGRFADARDHSTELMPGLAHLASVTDRGHAVSMALEYVFWNERQPVCLVRFSAPIDLGQIPAESRPIKCSPAAAIGSDSEPRKDSQLAGDLTSEGPELSDKQRWHQVLTMSLRDNQRSLADLSLARSLEPFENLLQSRGGGGVIYDSFRRIKSLFTGQPFQRRHESSS